MQLAVAHPLQGLGPSLLNSPPAISVKNLHGTTDTEQSANVMQVSGEKEFFAEMVVEAVSRLDPATLDMNMLGTKKVQGGGLRDSFLVAGVAFKKTFSYAGFEMQPKSYTDPKVLLLNIELELKSEKENAEAGESLLCIPNHQLLHLTLSETS